ISHRYHHRANQSERELLVPGKRPFVREQRIVGLQRFGRCVARHQFVSTQQKISGQTHKSFGEEVVVESRPLLVCNTYACKQSIGNHAGGRKRGKRARVRPTAHNDGHQKSTDSHVSRNSHRNRGEKSGRCDISSTDTRQSCREEKENDGDHADVAPRELHALSRDLVQSSVHVGLAEEERNSDQNEEQARRKSGRHIGGLHSPQPYTDDERKGNGEEANIDFRQTTNNDGDSKRNHGKYRKIHVWRTLAYFA